MPAAYPLPQSGQATALPTAVLQHIEARCRKEIPQVGHTADEARQRARLQPEFYFVVRVDEIQLPVPDGDAFPSQQPFKPLYRRPRPFDAHQLPDASRLLAACLQ